MVRIFVNGQGDWSSIPRSSHTKDSKKKKKKKKEKKKKKRVLDASLLNTQYYKVCIKGEWSDIGKGVASSPYISVSLWVALDYIRPTYLFTNPSARAAYDTRSIF